MTAFHEVQFPTDVSLGATGGPQFHTTIMQLASGFEKRNIDWSKTRAKYDVGLVPRPRAAMDAVIAFYYARQGRAFGFRFKEWADYKITAQSIGVGASGNVTFQAFKAYVSGGITYMRPIRKIVAGTYVVKVAGVVIVEGSGAGKFQIDITTGIITFGTAPADDADVNLTCEFDVPVRFDTDWLDFNVLEAYPDGGAIGQWPSIPLLEIRT